MRTIRANRPMRLFALVLWMGVLVCSRLACAQNASPVPRASAPTSDAGVAFDALKGLSGAWSGRVTTEPPNPEIEGPIHVTMCQISPVGSHSFPSDRGPFQPRRSCRSPVLFLS